MWNSYLQLDTYQYVKTNPYTTRLIGILGIVTTCIMAYGLWKFVRIDLLYILLFGPLIIIFVSNKLLRFSLQLFFPKFDIKRHEQFLQNYWATHQEPSVDIFLPWAGEDLTIHAEVVKAVFQLNYTNYHVYMLDDKGSEEHKRLAESYGFIYLSRPNKGQYKKSGNLEFGYKNSQGEFIFILDADFIPTKNSLHDVIPYMASDSQIGILQTPQYFEQTDHVHKRSMIEFGGGNIVEDFYRVLMPCRDEFKAAMCVGTSALYRREAILKLHGTPKVHASEDLATGLLITEYGYYVKYLPLIVSMGKSPETYEGYFKQHMRWCSGNLVFAKYWPHARLNLMARIIYITNPLYYLSEALALLFSFQFLALLYFNPSSLSVWNTIYFLPYLLLSRVIVPLTKKNKNKVGTKLAALSNSYTYLYTYIRMAIKGVPTWQPTGVKTSIIHEDFLRAMDMGAVISLLYIGAFLFIIVKNPLIFGNYNAYIILAWTFYSVFWHSLFLTHALRYIHKVKVSVLTSDIEKVFLFTKAHSIAFVSFILVGFTFLDISQTIHTPNTPIALAVSKTLTYGVQTTIAQPITARFAPRPTPAVLAVAIKNEKALLTFTVAKGDTPNSLSSKALKKYLALRTIALTPQQMAYATTTLTQSISTDTLKSGQKISFNITTIERSILASFEVYPQASVSAKL